MPSIDFAALRAAISLAQVLDLLKFMPVSRKGDELRGPCPIHRSSSPASRSFAANLRKNTFQCFRCGAGGNQLDLWAAAQNQPIYEAAIYLCQRVGVPLPVLNPRSSRKTESEKRSP